MADDRMTAVYDREALRKKYENYLVPAARVSVGGREITPGFAQLESVQVSLNLDAAASASFTVTDIYDLQGHSLKAAVKSAFACGASVKIELGYGSEYEDVFHGFIYETSVQFSDFPSMQVTAMDVKRLLADNTRSGHVWREKTVSAIFSEVLSGFPGLGLNVRVEDKGSEVIDQCIQRGSDLYLVKKLCRDKALQFLVYGDQAKLFAKQQTTPMLTLAWGSEILSFTRGESYVNVRVEVRGSMKGSPESGPIILSEAVSSPGAAASGLSATEKIIELTNVETKEEVSDRLKDEVDALKESMYSGRGSCVGMPVLQPGRYITIAGLDEEVNGDYYLKSVSHSFGGDGFATDFTLGGKKA
ncbi:MAG: contractile injection system protein, VgrG/Pvc8 family [Muribaculaceae bacterium]|nr:contractile injection system protein, VgrG/Pvc8 family [Muribaculaceae bacterium]